MSIRLGSINLTGGSPGKSAYEYAQEGGYTGTEADFAAILANISGGSTISSSDPGVNYHKDGYIWFDSSSSTGLVMKVWSSASNGWVIPVAVYK